MSDLALTVGGLPGTGTTTLCAILADRLALDYTYAGRLFREAADDRGVDLATFGTMAEQDPSIDRELDDRQRRILTRGACLLEGRLAGWLAHDAGTAALKVWLTCDREERIHRLVDRDGGDVAEQEAAIDVREASEADRYQRYYGIDLSDLSIYDLVLDSTDTPPDVLADQVEAAWAAAVGTV